MAIPTITNNSPSAGRIAWGAFNIQLNGVTYAVAAGSTDQRWVWWKYNAGVPVITAGPDVPTTLVDDDLVLFANKNGIGVRVQSTNFVDGELLVDGSIFAEALSTNLINSQHIVTAGLDAGVVKFGTMSGDRIGVNTLLGDRILANSIVGSKMAITDFNSLVDINEAVGIGKIFDTDHVIDAGWSKRAATTGVYFMFRDKYGPVPFKTGERIKVDFEVVGTMNDPATVNLWVYGDANLSQQLGAVTIDVVAQTVSIEADVTVDTNLKTSYLIGLTGLAAGHDVKVRNVTAYRMNAGKLIVDGSVTANKVGADVVVANEVFSREGYFGAVEAEQLRSGSLTAELGILGKLAVGAISIDPDGISVPGPNGITLLSSTGEGHNFAGSVETDDVTINGGLTVNAKNNTINGEIKLSNVVVPPTQPPIVSRYWPYTTPVGADAMTLTDSHDGTKWVTINFNDQSVRTYSKTTGAMIDKFPEEYWHHDYVAYNIARIGNYYFMVMWKQSASEWWLCRVGNAFGSFTALDSIVAYGNVGVPAVGPNLDNGNVITAYAATDDVSMRYIEWTQAGVQVAGTSALWDSTYDAVTGDKAIGDKTWCTSVIKGATLGFGETPAVITVFGSWAQIWDPTTKKITGWPGRPEAIKGLCVEYGTTNKLRWMGYNTYRIYEFVREAMWTNNHSITYSWFDSKLAGTGKHETTPSPPLVYTGAYKWGALQIDAAAPSNTGGDDSPDSVVIYIDNQRQPEVPVGKASNVFRTKTAGVAAKTTNEFAGLGVANYPGAIVSSATFFDGVSPRLQMRGDGTGNWGDLVVDGNGKAVIGGDTGWIAVTAFVNLWENYGGSWTGAAYRRIGNRLHLRGLIRGPGTLGGDMFYLPVGFRPATDQLLCSTIAQQGKTIDAVGDGSKDTGNKGTGSAGTSHFHDISAYDIRTTVSFGNIGSRLDVVASTGAVQHQGGSDSWGGSSWISLFGITFLLD